MALFQKKPQVGTELPLYSVGLQQTKLIVGLGNPGKEYDSTRHNIGFACVDLFVKSNELPEWRQQKDLQCLMTSGVVGGIRTIVLKPTTFMNDSGVAVQKAAHYYKLSEKDVVAVYDELDIPFGQVRSRLGGSSAGHNGVKSIMEHVGEEFGRIRVGIMSATKGQKPSKNFVLEKFTAEEQGDVPLIIQEVSAMINECIHAENFPVDTRTVVIPGL